jgi:hypothetical protein
MNPRSRREPPTAINQPFPRAQRGHPEQSLKGISNIAQGWHLGAYPGSTIQTNLPPLSRNQPRQTPKTPPRGRGRGWGNINPRFVTIPTAPVLLHHHQNPNATGH